MTSVHGAVVARIQLGFDKVADEAWNLKPIIADLSIKLQSNLKPLINKQADTGMKNVFDPRKKALPPMAPGGLTNRSRILK